MKLQEIINTACYVQFDSNEQLKKWVKANNIKVDGSIYDEELYIAFFVHFLPSATFRPPPKYTNLPVYHHSTITI